MSQIFYSIAAVQRETGLSSDTLRVWERRYGFPQPVRDSAGDRAYPADQLERLRLIARLIHLEHRPRHIVALPLDQLQGLQPTNPSPEINCPGHPLVPQLCALVQQHDPVALRSGMVQAIAQLGLEQFIEQVACPVTVRIGDDWMCGKLHVFEEHLYTECLTQVLRAQLDRLQGVTHTSRPRVLLSTLQNEAHGLGLLMAQIFLTLEGCCCLSLGLQTPLDEIAKAAQLTDSDIFGLSFSAHAKAKDIAHDLQHLRALLPAKTPIWAGGRNAYLDMVAIEGVTPMPALAMIPSQLQHWRSMHLAGR